VQGAFTNPETLAALKAQLKAQATALDAAATACTNAGKLDASTLLQWQALNARIQAWLVAEPWLGLFGTAELTDQGEALQRETAPWYDRFRSLGCASVPATPEMPSKPADSASLLASIPPIALVLVAFLLIREVKR
jgi:hypothetical protein